MEPSSPPPISLWRIEGYNGQRVQLGASDGPIVMQGNGAGTDPLTLSLYQAVDTPDSPFVLQFDHYFQTTNGALDVLLNSRLLASVPAPAELGEDPVSVSISVTDPELMGLKEAVLEFRFTGPEGSEVLLSNIGTTEAGSEAVAPAWIAPLGLTAAGFEGWLEVRLQGNYRIDWSEDLVSWDSLMVLTNVVGQVRVVDPSATGAPRRFYRAVLQ